VHYSAADLEAFTVAV